MNEDVEQERLAYLERRAAPDSRQLRRRLRTPCVERDGRTIVAARDPDGHAFEVESRARVVG